MINNSKLPPNAVELEEAVIGALLLEKDAILEVMDILTEASFYKDYNQRIYKAIKQLNDNSEAIDILTVTQQLKKNGDLDLVGGAYAIMQLTNRIASAANIEHHARIVREKEIARDMIRLCSDVITSSYDDTTDVFDTAEYLLTKSYEIDNTEASNKTESNIELLRQLKKNIEEAKTKKGITGLTTGIQKLDKHTGGYQNTHLIIKAGRPSMGKSAQAVCEANHMANEAGKKVLFFSLEMSAIELMNRIVSVNTEIPLTQLKEGNMTSDDWKKYNEKTSELMNDNLTIIDIAGISLNAIRKIARKQKIKKGLDAIYIDYLQLISHDTKGGNREQEISAISRGLKKLAKDLNVPVIALAQLSREVEKRGGPKKPMLSDLRESGSIEQDADSVQFLYRPEYYGITEDDEGNSTIGKGFLLIAKDRHNGLKDIEMRFKGQFTKFEDWNELPQINNYDSYNPNAAIEPNNSFDDEDAPF